jgi:hypothetical protein
MPVAVAREIVERTPAGLRSEYSAYRANPSGVIDHGQVYVKADEEENLPACYVHRLSVPVDDTKTRARVELDGYVYGWEYTIPETPYDGWPPPGAVRYAVYSREEPFGKEKGRKGNPEWLSFRVRPGDDPTDKAFDAGKYWARIGAYQSGVSNANVRKYGFNRWYNDQSPGGMYREGPPRRKLKKSTLERSFNGGYRIGKEEGRRSNPAGSAAALYETFHGIPSESETVITEQIQYHGNLAELGIGTSHIIPGFPTGYMVDKGRLGHIHIAFGRNDDIGGKTRCMIHQDSDMTQATIVMDGVTIMENGVLKI